MFNKLTATATALANKATDKVKTGVANVTRPSGNSKNSRNNAMAKELKDFSEHVKILHKEITDCSNKLAVTVAVIGQVMAQPLPRAYDYSTVPQAVEIVGSGTHRAGEGVDVNTLSSTASTDMIANVKKQVLLPIENWLTKIAAVEDKNHKCDALAKELGVQIKHVECAERNAAELQSKGHKDTKAGMDQLQAEQAKEQSLHTRFATTEAQIFNELLSCIQEATELRRYSLVALQSLQEFLTRCTGAFNLQVPIEMKLPSQVDPSQAGIVMPAGKTAEAYQQLDYSHQQQQQQQQPQLLQQQQPHPEVLL